jgi:hypothetical protein
MAYQTKPSIGRRARILAARWYFVAAFSLVVLAPINAQTSVDLRNQAKNIDFSGAAATKVWKTGSILPPSCNVGEGFFLIGGGPYVYVCSSPNSWSAVAPSVAGKGTQVQTVNGNLAVNAVPSVDSMGTEVNSGCTANAGAMICSGGFSGGVGATRITASEGNSPAPPSSGQQTLYVDSTDHKLKSVDSNSLFQSYATIDGSETLTAKTMLNPSVGATAVTSSFLNEAVTGTTVNKLAKLTGAPSSAILASTVDSAGVLGIVVSAAGKTGSAEIALSGQANCVFDAGSTAGDYVVISGITAGACHDAGPTSPTSGQILGRVLSSNIGAGTYGIQLFGPEKQAASGSQTAGSSFDPLDASAAYWRDEMFTTNQWFSKKVAGGTLLSGDDAVGDPAHPGIVTLATSYDATSTHTLLFSRPADGWVIMHYPAGLAWEQRWIVKPYSVPGASYEAGFSEPSGTSFLRISGNLLTSPNWVGTSINAGVVSTIDLGVPVTNSWARLRLRSDGAKIYFSVNGSTEKTLCPSGCDLSANIAFTSSTQVWPYAEIRNQIAYNCFLGIDFFAMQIAGVNR